MKKITSFISIGLIALFSNYSFSQTARVQVIHNCADLAASTVDVYLNGTILLNDFAFRTSTPFIDAPAGLPISIDVAPGNSSSVAESIYNLSPTLTAGSTYILVANGIVSASGYSPSQPFQLSVFALGREAASDPANVDVVVNHGSTDAPTVDIVETSVPAGTIVNDISYPSFTADYLELANGDYVINVTDATGSVVVASYNAPLATLGLQGQSLMVLASGFLDPSQNSNGPAFGLWVALAAGGDLIPLPLVPTTARLQVIHNCADLAAATVDVYVNDAILLNDFAFRTATPFIDVPAGVVLSIDVAPGNSTSSADSLYNLSPTLAAGETYILVANGIVSASGYSPAPAFELSVFGLGREVASNAGNTDIIVNHGSTDAPTVDVVETSVPAGMIVNDISFPQFDSAYLELPTADYTLDVTDATGTVVVATYSAPLATLALQGQALTVLASGFLDPTQNSNGPAFGLWVALAAGGDLIPLPLVPTTARLQVIHNCADLAAATVDVYVNDAILLNDFAFRTATPFIDVPAGVVLSIDVAPGNSTSSADSLYNLSPTLAAGETYILVANGIVSASGYSPAPAFELSVFGLGREVASNAGNTDIIVNHGSTDAPTVDVVETSVPAGTIVNDISFPQFDSAYLELPTADYTLDVTDATGTVVVATYSAPLATLALQGQALTVLASGFLDPTQNSNGPAFGLWVALAAGGDLIPLPVVPLGVDTFTKGNIVVYPNPVSSELNINIGTEFNSFSATICDMSGRVIIASDKYASTINTSVLADGVYMLTLKIDDQYFTQKIIVNN